MLNNEVLVKGVWMSLEAAKNVKECGVDVAEVMRSLTSEELLPRELFEHCLKGAEQDRWQGWLDFVQACSYASQGSRWLEEGE